MKLHLGCGHLYLPGAVNIDKHDLCIADVQADAIRLPVKSKSCDTVFAYHVIEHLGYKGAVYALAEAFRVLKPDDPEGSFQAFLERSEPMWRAHLLSWIFGTEISGMGHGGLFPRELLQKLATEAGFCCLKFTEPKTHTNRWGFRLVAKASNDPVARLIAKLRPSIVAEVLQKCTPQEALEMELRLWAPVNRLLHGELTSQDAENLLLELTVVAPKVIHNWAELSAKDKTTPTPACSLNLKNLGRLADNLLKARLCSFLRDAFSAHCAMVNQVPDGYFPLLTAAKKVAQRWLASPPSRPEEELANSLEACGVLLRPKANLTFTDDFEISSGQTPLDGRSPRWPQHDLFTRQHFIERVHWFRDLGIKCFASGDLEQARCAFRLAVNSKMQDLYSLWNMARLQAVLDKKNNAEIFYKAALGFPLPDELKSRIFSELKNCSSGKPISIGPVSVGEGQDRIFGFLEKTSEKKPPSMRNIQTHESRRRKPSSGS